jgi:hypothetical protein
VSATPGSGFDAVSVQLGRPVPPPGIPGPFSLAGAGEVDALLADAGLTDVAVEELPVPLRAQSFEQWWERTSALAGPLATIVASLPEPATRALTERVREAAAAYETPAGLEFPGLSLIAVGRAME